MESNGPAGRVTNSAGDVDRDGELVGRLDVDQHTRLLTAIGPIEPGEQFDADGQADLVTRLLDIAGARR